MAIGTAIIAFAAAITDIGVGAALVQRQRDVRGNASAAFYMNAVTISLFAVTLLLLSGPVAAYYGEPDVRRLLPLLTLGFLLRGLPAVHEAYLRKRLLFRRLQLVNIASVGSYGVVAVGLAWLGAGAWSLAWGVVAGGVVYAGLIFWSSGMPLSTSPHWSNWRGLFAFGRWVFLAGVVTWALQSIDNLAVGKILGPADLGAYAIAYSLGMVPFLLIGGAIAQALFPAYAQLQESRDELRILLMKIVRLSAVVSLPIAGVVLFTGGDVVVALLGQSWARVGPPFQVYAVVFTALMFTASFPRVFDALNRPAHNFYIALAAVPVLLLGLAIGLQYGILAVSLGVSAMVIEVGMLRVVAASRIASLSIRTIINGVWPSAACVGAGIGVGAVLCVPLRGILPSLIAHAIASLAMLTIFALSLRCFFPSRWAEASSQGHAVFRTARPASQPERTAGSGRMRDGG